MFFNIITKLKQFFPNEINLSKHLNITIVIL